MRYFVRGISWIEHAFQYVANSFVFVMMIITTADVIARNAFNQPIPGVFEATFVLLVFVIYLGLAYSQSVRGHVRVEMVINFVKGRKREVLDAVVLFIALVVLFIMFWRTGAKGWEAFVVRDYEPGLLAFPIWPGKLVVSLGVFFLCIRIAIQIGEHINRAVRGGGPPVEAPEEAQPRAIV